MERVTGIGGVFFKSSDPEALRTWYREHLGIEPAVAGVVVFPWHPIDEPERTAATIWAPFEADTDYFGPGAAPFMINYRVADLDALLAQLAAEGVWIDERREESELGRFAWITDNEGRRIELWEPPASELGDG